MSTGQIILDIALFAVAGAILYAWGLKKSMDQREDLLALAESCGISSAAALKLIRSITARQDSYLALCRESWLPEDMKTGLADLICRRMAEMQ